MTNRFMKNVVWIFLIGAMGVGIINISCSSKPAKEEPQEPKTEYPTIAETFPKIGQTDVDPRITAISVTFDRDMSEGMSWTGGGPQFPQIPRDKKPYWKDKRTCVLPVTLQAGHSYRLGINSQSHQNFKSATGISAPATVFTFNTRGASAQLIQKPRVVKLVPANKARNVDPKLKELRVTFNMKMGKGMSWTGGGENFPATDKNRKALWTNDGKTCILPVILKPNWDYRLGINSRSYKNFKSESGIASDPIVYTFSTGNRR